MGKLTIDDLISRLRAQPKGGPDVSWERSRAAIERESAKAPLPKGTEVTNVDAGGVPAEWVLAAGKGATADGPTVLYLHGGGYTIGSSATHRALAAHLSAATGGRVLTADYRLAPEHPFPAAVDDATKASRWLLDQPGASADRTVRGGDSAGGGLTAAAVLALKAAGDRLPAGVVCISPWVDMEANSDSHTTRAADDPMVDAEGLGRMRAAYLAGADPRDPLASPVHGDWTGAPPLLIQVGTNEVLLDDARALAERARAAGVKVELEEWDGMIHVWHSFCGLIDEADQAVARIGAFVREVTA
jgi:phosphinothricin tripeptide acetyl hydrolase